MQQIAWFNRTFYFHETQNVFPALIERLSGTPVRLEEKVSSIAPNHLEVKHGGSWSIKENIGHLIELEPLWQNRLHDVLTGKQEMQPADLGNTSTHEGNYNAKPIDGILATFRLVRFQTITKLKSLTEDDIFKSAYHPRLKQPMRVLDLFYFVAEHDDYHLARITEILNLLETRQES
jgi:uncharacterized damage-inducible protein DinB